MLVNTLPFSPIRKNCIKISMTPTPGQRSIKATIPNFKNSCPGPHQNCAQFKRHGEFGSESGRLVVAQIWLSNVDDPGHLSGGERHLAGKKQNRGSPGCRTFVAENWKFIRVKKDDNTILPSDVVQAVFQALYRSREEKTAVLPYLSKELTATFSVIYLYITNRFKEYTLMYSTLAPLGKNKKTTNSRFNNSEILAKAAATAAGAGAERNNG